MKKVLAITLILAFLLFASIIISTPEVSARSIPDVCCGLTCWSAWHGSPAPGTNFQCKMEAIAVGWYDMF